MTETRIRINRYTVALLSFGAGLLIRFAIFPALGQTAPYITFFPSVMVSAWYGGLAPGLVTTVLSAAAALLFFLEPLPRISDSSLLGLALFLAVGSVIS